MGLPVILCGKSEDMGKVVIANLKPEYDVVHFVQTSEVGQVQIPKLLRGDESAKPPVAVIVGGGFEDAKVEAMMRAVAGGRPVPWLRPDVDGAGPPRGPDPGREVVARVKALLARLREEGKMDEGGVHWY
ncbi:hypothetical protein GGR56DRAFT_676779 [Xylariaceae sp. FL0804]|nr:hypothetical protein GGR56DRAFT_676779 [Xylariaceae sp. FL0804]